MPRVTLQLKRYKQTFLFFCRWYLMPSLAVQAWNFLRKLVCLLGKFVLCYHKRLAFVCLCERKASSVVRSFHPMSASAGDMPFFTVLFGVVRYERRNACCIFSVVIPFPLCFEQSTCKCVHKTFCLTIGMWVVEWSTNMCYATWPAEMTKRLRCELCSIAWDINLRQAILTEQPFKNRDGWMGVCIFHWDNL